MTGARLLLAVPVLVAALVAGCSGDRTMLVVEVRSNMTVPDALDGVRVVVVQGGKQVQNVPFSLMPGSSYQLPLRMGLVSSSGGSAEVSVTVTGLRGSTQVVSVDAITSFIEGKSLLLEMFLAAECASYDCGDPSKTCVAGPICIDKRRVMLPPFDPSPKKDAGAGGSGGGDASIDTRADTGVADTRTDTGAVDTGAVDTRADTGGVDRGACTALGPEDCFNGVDDDCNGSIDCADPACTPTTTCVPLGTSGAGTPGTNVTGAAGCPSGFGTTSSKALMSGLSGGSACTGCACGGSSISCRAGLTVYLTAADCAAGANGYAAYTMSTDDTNMCPVPLQMASQWHGALLAAWSPTMTPCAPSGTPQKPAPTWTTTVKFCGADKVGGGCPTGQACIAKPAGSRACVLVDGAGTCPAGTTPPVTNPLYTGLTDARSCGTCTCGSPNGSCAGLRVEVGSDYSCMVDYETLTAGVKNCWAAHPNGIYDPGYYLSGAATRGTCAASSTITGTATPSGPSTLCCLP